MTAHTLPAGITAALCRIKRFGQPVEDSDALRVTRDAARLQADLSMMLDIPVEVLPYAYTTEWADKFLHLMRYQWGEMRANVDQDVDHTHWLGWGGIAPTGVCGQANAPDRCWSYEFCGYRTHIHEFGHLLGLGHSAEYGETGDYGDELSIMGDAGENRVFIAPHRAMLGLYGDKVARFDSDSSARSYRLIDSQIHGDSAPSDSVGFIEVETGDGLIGLGFDMGRIRAYRPNQNNSWARTEVFDKDVREIRVGDVWITRGERHTGLIGVHVHRVPFNYAPVRQFEIQLPPNVDELGEVEGIWGNSSTYQGLVIWRPRENHPAADVIIGWVTWDRVGDPRWCYVLGKQDGDVVRGQVMSTRRDTLAQTESIEEGDAVLYRDGENLIFHHNTDGLSARRVRLTRSAESDHSDLTGWYAFEGVQHEGLWVSTYTSGAVVAYWLRHTTDTHLRGHEQQWFIIQGDRSDLGVEGAFTIYQPSHAQRTWATGKRGLEVVGNATLDPERSRFSYESDGRWPERSLYRVFSFDGNQAGDA